MTTPRTIICVRGNPILLQDDGRVTFKSGYTVCADGSPFAYGPRGTQPLDYFANAGEPGNWYGVVTDSNGRPVVQGAADPAPGYYVSPTAYARGGFEKEDPRRYLWADVVPYVVIPGPLRRAIAPVLLGCRARVRNTRNGKVTDAVCGEIGPATHLGEISIRCAELLGLPYNPRRDGEDAAFLEYTLWPGECAQVQGVRYPLLPAA